MGPPGPARLRFEIDCSFTLSPSFRLCLCLNAAIVRLCCYSACVHHLLSSR
eukprot:m.89125 g.89125  ORF g.89125 m.89125 type:complete len:51 (+) comp13642_c0_seq2:1448-1600(+)